jgi:2,3-bisphosphoglycerate-dependent phosphoglycerate mutase
MLLTLIRHGQSENNALWERSRSDRGRVDDPELTELGRRQAALLAGWLAAAARNGFQTPNNAFPPRAGLSCLYTSLMVRASETATLLAERLGLPLMAWVDLHEQGGIYLADEESGAPIGREGKNRAYFEQRFPAMALPDSLGPGGWWNRPYETPDQAEQRARRVLEELLRRHGRGADHVGLVSHAGFYNALMREILNIRPAVDGQEQVWFLLENTAMTQIEFTAAGRLVIFQNQAEHLSREIPA